MKDGSWTHEHNHAKDLLLSQPELAEKNTPAEAAKAAVTWGLLGSLATKLCTKPVSNREVGFAGVCFAVCGAIVSITDTVKSNERLQKLRTRIRSLTNDRSNC